MFLWVAPWFISVMHFYEVVHDKTILRQVSCLSTNQQLVALMSDKLQQCANKGSEEEDWGLTKHGCEKFMIWTIRW